MNLQVGLSDTINIAGLDVVWGMVLELFGASVAPA